MKGAILVVDDDPAMQQTITMILEDEGYTVLVAGDGIEALAVLQQTSPAAIVLDITMPRMDGYAFAEELGRRGLRPAIPVMVLTADGRAAEKARRIGAEGYLAKPFSVLALVGEIERLTQSRRP